MSEVIRVALSSLTAGALNDGALRGQINQSLHHAVISNVQLATNKYVLRMDFDKGTFTDLSAVITANTPTTILGAQADLNPGDGILVACDDETTEIGVNLSTVGVGTWTAVEIYDSTNGTTFNRQITGFTDNTGAFKLSGWRNIVLPTGSETGRVALSPSPILNIASRKWILIKLAGASFTVTTAPVVTGMYVKHHQADVKWFDLTASTNGDVTVAPTGTTFHPSVGSVVAYFFDELPVGWERYVFQAQANVRTRILRYATNAAGTVFADVQGVSDPSNDFTVVPSPVPQQFSVRWTPPTNAVRVTRSFAMTTNTTLTITNKYMFIIETTAVTSIAPINPTLGRVRAKMLGTAGTSGDQMSPMTVRRVTAKRHGGSVGSGAITYQLHNFTQSTSLSFTFPEADGNAEQNYDPSDLTFADGDRLGLYHAAGSRVITDFEVALRT